MDKCKPVKLSYQCKVIESADENRSFGVSFGGSAAHESPALIIDQRFFH